ncbi:hypothetical protein [Thiofilum flexile]|uniref:hypothetical protein n=1 Tax=Thiofilum flexile TaxID=125627 RepID=UPI000369875F|nr:hypothetical protein [Thiofilum flexile]
MISKPTKKLGFGLLAGISVVLLSSCAAPAPAPTHDQVKEAVVADTIRATTPMERATALTDVMTNKLRLNESQQAKVAKLNLDYSSRFNILMNSTNPKISKKDEFLRLSAEKETKLLGILSASQKQTYEASKQEFLDTYRIM